MFERSLIWGTVLFSTVIPAVPAVADSYVETRGGPATDDDPRHPTATADVIELEAPFAEPRDLSERLAELPGVHPRRTSFGQTAYATIRGSSSRQVHVEWEGLRLNPPFGPGYDFAASSLGFDELVVWRGPAATYRGSGAVAGAMEFRTKHLRTPGRRFVGSALGGSFGSVGGSADLSIASETVSTRLAVGGRASDGAFPFVDAQGTESLRVNNDHRRHAVMGSSEYRAGDTTVRATALVDRGERGTPGQSEFQEQFAQARLADARQLALLRTERRNIARLGSAAVDAFASAGAQRRELAYRNPAPFLRADPVATDSTSTTVAGRIGSEVWMPNSVLRLEADGRADRWIDAAVDTRVQTGGIGASWEQSFADRDVVLFASGRAEANDNGSGALLPAVGARFQITDAVWVAGNGGRTYRAPDLDELYLDTEIVRGNPDLRPERAWVADVSMGATTEALDVRLTGFVQHVDAAIRFLPVSAYLVEARNISVSRSLGAEATAAARHGIVHAVVSYTLQRATFTDGGAPVPLQPTHRGFGRLALDASLPDGHAWRVADAVEVFTSADVRGPVYLDAFGNQRTRGFLFWDAGVSFSGDAWETSFHLRNVLDDNGALDSLQQPLPGRSVWFNFVWRSETT